MKKIIEKYNKLNKKYDIRMENDNDFGMSGNRYIIFEKDGVWDECVLNLYELIMDEEYEFLETLGIQKNVFRLEVRDKTERLIARLLKDV